MNSDQIENHLKILLIDDDPDEYRILKRILNEVKGAPIELDYVGDIASAFGHIKAYRIDIVLLDNRLLPNNDFRETAPQLRKAGFVGPIGVISSDISGSYFQKFPEFGADFRISKDEIDRATISFIISEYTRDQLPEECAGDFS